MGFSNDLNFLKVCSLLIRFDVQKFFLLCSVCSSYYFATLNDPLPRRVAFKLINLYFCRQYLWVGCFQIVRRFLVPAFTLKAHTVGFFWRTPFPEACFVNTSGSPLPREFWGHQKKKEERRRRWFPLCHTSQQFRYLQLPDNSNDTNKLLPLVVY